MPTNPQRVHNLRWQANTFTFYTRRGLIIQKQSGQRLMMRWQKRIIVRPTERKTMKLKAGGLELAICLFAKKICSK